MLTSSSFQTTRKVRNVNLGGKKKDLGLGSYGHREELSEVGLGGR